MKESLKTKLHKTISEAGFVTYNQLEQLVHEWGFKLATAERTLRPSISPEIRQVKKNGAIIRYEWKGTVQQQANVQDFLDKWGTKPKAEPVGVLF